MITIAYVEEVIARMGKPEELEPDAGDAASGNGSWDGSNHAGSTGAGASATAEKVSHHFYRNPDVRVLGGVVSGIGCLLGLGRDDGCVLVLVIIMIFGFKLLIPAYIICWIIVPEARTAAEKLSMRGEAVTVE